MKNREMKPSGIEWIGETPKHWDVLPIRYLFKEITTKNKTMQEKTALKFTYGTIIQKAILMLMTIMLQTQSFRILLLSQV